MQTKYQNSQTKTNNLNWRNQPQLNSLLAGGFIFLSAGMNMAQGTGWEDYSLFSGSRDQFRFSWFTGVTIGVVLSVSLINIVPKRILMGISAALIFFEGIIYTSAPEEYKALLVGRYLNGIGVGFATTPFIVHASEISVNTYRGSCLAIEQYSMCFGIAIQMIYSSQWNSTDFPANRLHGIFDIIFAVGAKASLFCLIESPIYYLKKSDEATALNCLIRLQRPHRTTTETAALLEEHKSYLRQNENCTLTQIIGRGVVPLFKILILRSMMTAFCFSLPLNIALRYSLLINYIQWPIVMAAFLRIFGAVLALIIVDGLGRKLPFLILMLIIGSLMIAVGAFFVNISNITNSHCMSIVTSLLLLLQFFAGMFVPFTSVAMGEAFSSIGKSHLVGFCVVVEQLIHIIIIFTFKNYTNNIYNFMLGQGILTIAFLLLLCASLPETRKTSLKEAHERFRKLINLKFH